MNRVFALSVHAEYACRQTGACCTAGWHIPVEPAVRAHVGRSVLVPTADGACPEYDRETRACRVHRDHGEAHLPLSCFQFPRRALIDDRGTFVTLSHFCPTAAEGLFDPSPLRIVGAPPAYPSERAYDGLDARGEWPPLLKPGRLFDWRGYTAWETYLVATLGRPGVPGAAVRAIADAAEALRAWTPDAGPLADRVAELSLAQNAARNYETEIPTRYRGLTGEAGYLVAIGSVPAGLQRPSFPPQAQSVGPEALTRWSDPVRRYLAAKAFASWTAYEGHGVRTLVAELVLSLAVLQAEAARAAARSNGVLTRQAMREAFRAGDRLLVHLVDRPTLMRALRTVEQSA
jgi:hypothetical protein